MVENQYERLYLVYSLSGVTEEHHVPPVWNLLPVYAPLYNGGIL